MFFVALAGDDKETYPSADLAQEGVLAVEAEAYSGAGGVIPQQGIALVGDHEGHTDALAARRVVVVGAAQNVAATVQVALLVLA